MKKLLIGLLVSVLFITPAFAMEGTDGTVDIPTNRINSGEIETGEGYENIVPINEEIEPINDSITPINEDLDKEGSNWLILGGVTALVVGAVVGIIIFLKKR